jgi:hypothetical protein
VTFDTRQNSTDNDPPRHGSSTHPFDGTAQALRKLIFTRTLTLAGPSAGKSSRQTKVSRTKFNSIRSEFGGICVIMTQAIWREPRRMGFLPLIFGVQHVSKSIVGTFGRRTGNF